MSGSVPRRDATDMRTAMTMRASVLCDVARLEVRDVPRPVPGARDLLVRISAVGLCGTDLHIFAGHANYHTDGISRVIPLTEQTQILGHEITGLVEEVGKDVHDLEAGVRVVIDQGLNCMSAGRLEQCEYCLSGDSHQCEFYGEHGITGLPGGLAEYICVPAVNAVRINSDIEVSEAAMTEPLGCILHSSAMVEAARTRYRLNATNTERRVRSVLICGAGPAGLLFTQYLRNVVGFDGLLLVSEPNERKRELARGFGADTINPNEVDLSNAVKDRTGGRSVEYLIEASGSGGVFALLPGLIRKQATVLLYGHGHAGVDLSVLNNLMFKEPMLVTPAGASGGFDVDGRPTTYRQSLHLIESRRVDVKSCITHRYTSLDSLNRVFTGDAQKPDYIKGVVML